jgi:death-on-curing protein
MKNAPTWMLEKTVLVIHEAQIAEHGGVAGVRDIGLLQSALAHPINLFAYGEATLFELAASYAQRIIKNHLFIDGNKRTSYVVMLTFLKLNGFELMGSKQEKLIQFIQLAATDMTFKTFIHWLNINVQPVSKYLSEK